MIYVGNLKKWKTERMIVKVLKMMRKKYEECSESYIKNNTHENPKKINFIFRKYKLFLK